MLKIRFIAMLLGIALLSGCSKAPSPAAPEPSLAAGEGSVSRIDAQGLAKLLEQAKGKAVVLNFWATWCPPCVAEMPELVRFYKETPRGKVVFISLSADDPSTIETAVRKFQKDKGLPFPIYVMSERDPDAIAKAARTSISGALPMTVIYAPDGKVALEVEGETTYDKLMATVKPFL